METFKDFFISLSAIDRGAFASRCRTSKAHLTNIAYGLKTCGERLAIDIERESGGAVRCETLRPDVDWAYLRGTEKNAVSTAPVSCECGSGDPRQGERRHLDDRREKAA